MSQNHEVRLDIQGLRGIAVLLVVVFHAQLAFPGGFIGVDVFFVISGFVISRMLIRELDATGTLSLRRFYERRVRRLLPPLAALIACVLPAVAVVMSPFGPQKWIGRTAAAASVFLGNMYLWSSGGGYFSPGDETNAFLHTWSLAVEEQFYLILPWLLLLAWSLGKRRQVPDPRRDATVLVAVVCGLSFLFSVALLLPGIRLGSIIPDPDRFTFYSLPTRFWEIGAGAIVALVVREPAKNAQQVLAVAGLSGVVWASLMFGRHTPFPGTAALVPVLSTAAMLMSPRSAVARFVSVGPLVRLGDISYSWYLWHWPLIVLARMCWPENQGALVAAAGVSLLPAWLSKRFVEDPIRSNGRLTGRWAVVLAVGCTVGPAALGLGLAFGSGSGWGLERPNAWKEARLAVLRGCVDKPEFDAKQCLFPVEKPKGTIVLLGDSHAGSIGEGVLAAAREVGVDVALTSTSGCPGLLGREPLNKACDKVQDSWLELVDRLKPQVVMIANRSSGYTLPAVPMGRQWRTIGGPHQEAPESQAEALGFWVGGMRAMLDELDRRSIKVIWVSVVPEFPVPFNQHLTILHPEARPTQITRDYLDSRRGPVLAAEARVIGDFMGRVQTVDPARVLCDAQVCNSVIDGEWAYMDEHHLNPHGSRLLSPLFRQALEAAFPPSP